MVDKIETRGRPKGSGVKYTDEYIEALAIELDKWIIDPANFWLGTFASEKGFNRHRLNDFAEKNETFRSIFEKAKQIQENKLFMLGLSGKGNVTMAIFALKNVAGWRDDPQSSSQEDDKLINSKIKFGEVKDNIRSDKFKQYLN